MMLKTIKGQQDTRVKPSDFKGGPNDAWDLFPCKINTKATPRDQEFDKRLDDEDAYRRGN